MNISYIHWDIDPQLFDIFGLSIRYYGLLFVGGLIVCLYVLKWIYHKEGIPVRYLDKLFIYGILGIFIGSRLGHCLFYEPLYYLSHPLEMILPIQPQADGGYKFTGYQGLASHGGVLGFIISVILYSKKTKESLLKTLDLLAIVSPIGSGFIRLANLMNSEIIGKPASYSWAFVFKSVDNIPRHPAQLYEAVLYFLIFFVLVTLYLKYYHKRMRGFLFGIMLVLIFTGRFFLEFIKENQVAFESKMFLNMGQLLSIPFVLAGLFFIIRSKVNTSSEYS